MEFSRRSFAVVSLLLLVSLSTEMSGPLVVDAGCDWQLCQQYCSLLGKPACCSGLVGPCICQAACPFYVTKETTKERMAGATDEELIIFKETVTA